MRGYNIFKKAVTRLGYSEAISKNFLASANELLNQIALDLKLAQISDLNDKLSLNEAEIEALCCGLAMLISLTQGDREKNQIYTNLYNSKRAALLFRNEKKEDCLPISLDGDA